MSAILGEPNGFYPAELRECAEREVEFRRRVYGKRQQGNPLTREQKRQIAMMEAIAKHFRELEHDESGALFGS